MGPLNSLGSPGVTAPSPEASTAATVAPDTGTLQPRPSKLCLSPTDQGPVHEEVPRCQLLLHRWLLPAALVCGEPPGHHEPLYPLSLWVQGLISALLQLHLLGAGDCHGWAVPGWHRGLPGCHGLCSGPGLDERPVLHPWAQADRDLQHHDTEGLVGLWVLSFSRGDPAVEVQPKEVLQGFVKVSCGSPLLPAQPCWWHSLVRMLWSSKPHPAFHHFQILFKDLFRFLLVYLLFMIGYASGNQPGPLAGGRTSPMAQHGWAGACRPPAPSHLPTGSAFASSHGGEGLSQHGATLGPTVDPALAIAPVDSLSLSLLP